MQPVDMHDCIARASVLNEAKSRLAHYKPANMRQAIALEWLIGKLRDEAIMWYQKSASRKAFRTNK